MILRQTHGFATEVDAMKTLAATLSLLFVSLSLPLATGCGDDKDTAGDDDGVTTSPLVEIISPADGTTITEGDTIQLEADIYDQDSGNPLTASEVTWSAPGWGGFSGASGSVSDLPLGELTLTVSATVDGRTAEDSVGITVEVGDIDYVGTFLSTNTWSGYGMEFADICEGDVSFVLGADGSMLGSGQCVLTVYYPGEQVLFDIVGEVVGGSVSGEMQMNVSGAIYANPFSGTRSQDDSITVSFDQTYPDVEGGDLQIEGNFTATPRS